MSDPYFPVLKMEKLSDEVKFREAESFVQRLDQLKQRCPALRRELGARMAFRLGLEVLEHLHKQGLL